LLEGARIHQGRDNAEVLDIVAAECEDVDNVRMVAAAHDIHLPAEQCLLLQQRMLVEHLHRNRHVPTRRV
jgi:hypothetical protein